MDFIKASSGILEASSGKKKKKKTSKNLKKLLEKLPRFITDVTRSTAGQLRTCLLTHGYSYGSLAHADAHKDDVGQAHARMTIVCVCSWAGVVMDRTRLTTADESRAKKSAGELLTSGWMELTNISSRGGVPEHITTVASNLHLQNRGVKQSRSRFSLGIWVYWSVMVSGFLMDTFFCFNDREAKRSFNSFWVPAACCYSR